MSVRRILVTGATGFLGAHLVRGLGSIGSVRAALRNVGSVPDAADIVVLPDLLDRKALQVACQGVQTVVHAMGRAHVLNETARDSLTEFRIANVEVTRTLLEAAVAAGVERFVLLSSIAVFDCAHHAALDSRTPPAPATPYGRSKLEAEELVRARGSSGQVAGIILRLPLVYGPGMKGNPLRLFRLVSNGFPVPVGAVSNLRSLLYVGNLVAAVHAVLESPVATGETFLVADSRPVSTAELVRLIAVGLNRPARVWRVPLSILRALGRTGDLLSRIGPFPLTSDAVDRLTGSLVVNTEELQRRTGFQAPISVEQGIATTAAWYREVT